MTRVCSDCAKPVVNRKALRCRTCANARVNAARVGTKCPVHSERQKARFAAAAAPQEAMQAGRKAAWAWLPAEWAKTYHDWVRSGTKPTEAKRMMREHLAAEERRRLAKMSRHERQVEALRNGAQLVERHPMPTREHAFSLTGSGMAAL